MSKSSVIKLLFGVILFTSQYFVLNGQQNFNVEYEASTGVPTFLNICGESDVATIIIRPTSEANTDITNLVATLQLFKGVEFESLNTSESSAGISVLDSNVNQPRFQLPNSFTEPIKLVYNIRAVCTFLDTLRQNESLMVQDTWVLDYFQSGGGTSETYKTAEYRDAFGVSAFTIDINNESTVMRVGQQTTRTLEISNSGLDGFTDHLVYQLLQDAGSSVTAMRVNGQPIAFTKNATLTGDTLILLRVEGAYFEQNLKGATLGNANQLFDADETLILEQDIIINYCNDTYTGLHNVEWGCDNTVCTTVSDSDILEIGEGTPSGEIIVLPLNQQDLAGYCKDGTILLNVASKGVEADAGFGALTNVMVGMGIGNFTALSDDSFEILSYQVGSQTITATEGGLDLADRFTSDPDGTGGLADIDNDGYFDDLPVGQLMEVAINYMQNCADGDDANCFNNVTTSLNAVVTFDNQCAEEKVVLRPSFIQPVNNVVRFENRQTTDAVIGLDTFSIIHQQTREISNIDFSCEGDRTITAIVTLPGGILPLSNGIIVRQGDKISPIVSQVVVNDTLYVTSELIDNSSTIIDYTWEFAFTSSCDLTTEGASSFPLDLRYNCTDCACEHVWYCGTVDGPNLRLLNPPCSSGEEPCEVGLITDVFEINRTTLGYTDADLTQPIAADNANTKIGLPCDEVQIQIEQTVGNTPISEGLGLVIAYQNPELVTSLGAIFLYDSGTLSINHAGQNYDCSIEINQITTVFENNQWRSTIDLSNCLLDNGLTLVEGDKINFTGTFTINSERSYSDAYMVIPNLRTYGYLIAEGTPIFCETKGTTFSVGQNDIVSTGSNFNDFPIACNQGKVSYRLLQLNQEGASTFQTEYRDVVALDSIVLTYDANILTAFDDATIWVTVPNHPIYGNESFRLPDLNTQTIGSYTARFDTLAHFTAINYSGLEIFEIEIRLQPTCVSARGSASNDNSYPIDATIHYKERTYTNGDCIELRQDAIATNFTYQAAPMPSLSPFGVTNFLMAEDTATWTVQYCNNSVISEIPATYLTINAPSELELIGITEISDIANPVELDIRTYDEGYFALSSSLESVSEGNSATQICNIYRIQGIARQCGQTTFSVYAGWNCQAFPQNWTPSVNANCEKSSLDLKVTTLDPQLDANIIEQPTLSSLSICDTSAVTILVKNTNVGTAYNIRNQLTLPQGMSIVANSMEIAYPSTADFQAVITEPELVENDKKEHLYIFENFANLNTSLHENGLPGFVNDRITGENEYALRFEFVTDCDYLNGSYIAYNLVGEKGCGEATNFEAGETIPIHIEGTEIDVQKNLTAIFEGTTNILPGRNTLQVRVTNLSDIVTDEGDQIRLSLPSELSYVGNSVMVVNEVSWATAQPAIFLNEGFTELVWQLPEGLTVQNSLVFSLEVDLPDFDCAATSNLDNLELGLWTEAVTKVDCYDEIGICDITTITSNQGQFFEVFQVAQRALELNWMQVWSACTSDTEEEIQIEGSLIAKGFDLANPSIQIQYYIDENNNDTLNSDELILDTYELSGQITADNQTNFSHNFTSETTDLCKIGVKVTTDTTGFAANCIAFTEQYTLPTPQLQSIRVGNQFICGESITTVELNPNPSDCLNAPQYQYSWQAVQPASLTQLSNVSSINPVLTVDFTSLTTDTLQFILLTERIACGFTSTDTVLVINDCNQVDKLFVSPIDTTICSSETIAFQATGGVSYQWIADVNNPTTNNLTATDIANPIFENGQAAGQYRYQLAAVIDEENNISDTIAVNIQIEAAPSIYAGEDQVICAGETILLNGIIEVDNENEYEVSWEGNGLIATIGKTVRVTPETSGIYLFKATKENGCNVEASVQINVEDCTTCDIMVEATSSKTTLCGQSNGAIQLFMRDTTTTYRFDWLTDLGEATNNNSERINLPAGAYQVIITDIADDNCSILFPFIIENEDALQRPTVEVNPTNCGGATGSIRLMPTEFEYIWEDGFTGTERTDLVEGTYAITYQNPTQPNCSNALLVEVESLNTLQADYTINRQPDCGETNGSVTILPTGGSGDYTYSWSTEGATIDTLFAGTYTVTVTDANAPECFTTVSFTLMNEVEPPTNISITITETTNVSCSGDTNGSVSFEINNPDNETIADTIISDGNRLYTNGSLPAGMYCMTIWTDDICLVAESCFEIEETEPIQVDAIVTDACETRGTATLSITGGTEPYTISWSDGSTDRDRIDLNAIEYALTVRDANNCEVAIDSITIDSCFIDDCTVLFTQDTAYIQTSLCDQPASYCMPIVTGTLENYEIRVGEELVGNEILQPCTAIEIGFYPYTSVLTSPQFGPFYVESWEVNDATFEGEFLNLSDLVDSMNIWDTNANWTLDTTAIAIIGGNTANTYSNLDISVLGIGAQALLTYNTERRSSGTAIQLSQGFHDLSITEISTGCVNEIVIQSVCIVVDTIDMVIIEETPDTICVDYQTNLINADTILLACDAEGFTVERVEESENCIILQSTEVGIADVCIVVCDTMTMLCDTNVVTITTVPTVSDTIQDIILVEETKQVELSINSDLLTGDIVSITNICEEKGTDAVDFELDLETLTVTYTGTQIGRDTACIEVCDDNEHCQRFDFYIEVTVGNTVRDTILVNAIDEYCIDTTGLVGDSLIIEQVCGDTDKQESVRFQMDSMRYCITYVGVDVGEDTICYVLRDTLGNSTLTTLIVETRQVKTDTLMDILFVNQTKEFCVDTTELEGEIISFSSDCEDRSTGDVIFTLSDSSPWCVEYYGVGVGSDTACTVICDDRGFCDTTIMIIQVLDYFEPPIANDDTISTDEMVPIVIDIKANDTIFGGIDTAYILDPPFEEEGTVALNLDCSVTFTPEEGVCERTSNFTYVVCNPNGCDTAQVSVYIRCVDIKIFTAVSPNGDGINDFFYIAGIEDKPDNYLRIYNRWGNLVYNVRTYKNNWEGISNDGDALPDGTYYYIFEVTEPATNEERVFRGYLELIR